MHNLTDQNATPKLSEPLRTPLYEEWTYGLGELTPPASAAPAAKEEGLKSPSSALQPHTPGPLYEEFFGPVGPVQDPNSPLRKSA